MPARNVRGRRESWVGFIKTVRDWCGGSPFSSEAERFNHAARVFEERSRELCLSSIASHLVLLNQLCAKFRGLSSQFLPALSEHPVQDV